VFAGGTAPYFHGEITFWAGPELHAAARHPVPAGDALRYVTAHLRAHGAHAERWFATRLWGASPRAHPPSA
jgi:hypothetical protein